MTPKKMNRANNDQGNHQDEAIISKSYKKTKDKS